MRAKVGAASSTQLTESLVSRGTAVSRSHSTGEASAHAPHHQPSQSAARSHRPWQHSLEAGGLCNTEPSQERQPTMHRFACQPLTDLWSPACSMQG